MVRLFVAIDLPGSIREKLREAQIDIVKSRARLNIVDPAIIHLTLKFIGEVDPARSSLIASALSSVSFKPFEMKVSGVGVNSIRQPRVIWCTIHDAGNSSSLHSMIEDVLHPLGILREERPFRAHATLARVKEFDPSLLTRIKPHEHSEFGTCVVNGFSLKKSTLSPQGPVYENIMEVTWK